MSTSRKPRRSRTLGPSSAEGSSTTNSPVASSRRGSSEAKALAPGSATHAKTPAATEDVVVVHSRTEDGEGMNVVRKRGDEISLGVVRPLEEGKPLLGDVVKLKPREEQPGLFDVETQLSISPPQPKAAGPSRVTNSSYRKGWDSLWGARRRRKPN